MTIKTIDIINKQSAQGFRREILVTNSSRRPCIVGLMGATWSCELTCFLFERMPCGSIGDLLDSHSASIDWSKPRLKLATDVARGMVYLRGR